MTAEGLQLARLERFIDFERDPGHPMYVTANGIRQAMPQRFYADALALRAALAASRPVVRDGLDSDVELNLGVVLAAVGPWSRFGTSGEFAHAIVTEWNRQFAALTADKPEPK